jgi:hypothetical protein
MKYSPIRTIERHTLDDRGCELYSRTSNLGNFGTEYCLESWSPYGHIVRNFSYVDEAFDALERWERINLPKKQCVGDAGCGFLK